MVIDVSIGDIIENFELLGDWEDRYQYIVELGRKLPAMDPQEKNERTRIEGCVSQVWLASHSDGGEPPRLTFVADSDAFIVRGLAYLLLVLFSGKTPAEILAIDSDTTFRQLGLEGHLSPTRANGLHAMVARIREIARAA